MVYYNTTTEPTPDPTCPFQWLSVVLNVIGIFSFTAVMTESVLQWIKYCDFGGKTDKSNREGEGEEKKRYIDNYIEEYTHLNERELNEVDFLKLKTRYVKEETPGGDVFMCYDKDTGCFSYYTNNLKEITYAILETVARKFVVENDCKLIYNLCKKSVGASASASASASVLTKSEVTEDIDSVSADEVVVEEKPLSVFAKFKKYNTAGKGSVPNFKAVIEVIEQTNHFRFKGKLHDYEEIVNRNEVERNRTNTPTLDYAAYKKQLLENNKKESKKEV